MLLSIPRMGKPPATFHLLHPLLVSWLVDPLFLARTGLKPENGSLFSAYPNLVPELPEGLSNAVVTFVQPVKHKFKEILAK